MGEQGVADEPSRIHFLKKPLFYWSKSFAEKNEVRREDSFSKFLASDVLNYVLEYIGIPTESDQSSLHLSSIFDEESPAGGGTSLPSITSARSKYESESKQRILKLSGVFNQLRSHYEDHFNQLLLIPPPNSVHITSACHECGIEEFEKILLLLLGAGIQGTQKQETIRKIREFPTDVQQELIQAIKHITDSPELFEIQPWTQFGRMTEEDQQQIYESLIAHIRRLIYERNEAIQSRFMAEFGCGLTNCEQKREQELRGYEGTELEKYSDENRTSAAMRQLREELIEKSDLLKECREELEITKSKLLEAQQQFTETQKQLKGFRKSRDEFDILREGQEKAIRLEAEVLRMKKKLEESEQYYEQVEILQNENRTYQRKHAILMDQINMLTVEKERLEVSFMTVSNHRSPHPKHSSNISDDEEPRSFSYVPNILHFPEELLLDSDEEKGNVVQEKETCAETKEVDGNGAQPSLAPTPTPTSPPSNVRSTINTEEVSLTPPTPQPKYKDAETQKENEELRTETPTTATAVGKSPREKRHGGPKRGHRRSGGFHGKRTKKSSLFPHHPKVTLQKVQNLTSLEKLDQVGFKDHQEKLPETNPSEKKKHHRRPHSKSGGRHQSSAPIERREPTPVMRLHPRRPEPESDADEELSLSPNPNYRESSSDLESDVRSPPPRNDETGIPFQNFQDQSPSPQEVGGSEEDELFFVCSTALPPAMARNVRIYAPSRDPHPYHQHQSEFFRQSPNHHRAELLGSPILNLRPNRHFETPEEKGPDRSPAEEEEGSALIGRCSIEVSLRNGNSHQFSLLEPEHEDYVEQSMLRHHLHQQQPIRTHPLNPGSTTEEDEDSVWYEYGCV